MKKLLLSLLLSLAFSGFAFAAVNLNTATKEELESVKGIGPAKAEAIIAYRKQNGPFKKVDELKAIKGFGDKSVNKLRNEVTVSASSTKTASVSSSKKTEKQ